jgi:hypothetical protein
MASSNLFQLVNAPIHSYLMQQRHGEYRIWRAHTFGSRDCKSSPWAWNDLYTLLLSGFSDPGRATEYGAPLGGGCASSSARARCAGLEEKKTIVTSLLCEAMSETALDRTRGAIMGLMLREEGVWATLLDSTYNHGCLPAKSASELFDRSIQTYTNTRLLPWSKRWNVQRIWVCTRTNGR